MTETLRAMPCTRKAGHAVRSASFHFGLRSLFFVTTVCAILSALYSYFGKAVILALLLGAAACWAVTWVIDASLAMRDIVLGILRRRPTCDAQDGDNGDDANSTTDGAIDELRIQEETAAARYNARTGSLEDVLRARSVRLLAEIAVLRGNSARRQLQTIKRPSSRRQP